MFHKAYSNTTICDSEKNKNALYIVNSTIRNTTRIYDFLMLANNCSTHFPDPNINISDLIDFAEEKFPDLLLKSENRTSQNQKIKSYTKRFSELKTLGLIDFKTKEDTITFNSTEYAHEVNYFKNNDLIVKNPTAYRYEKLEQSRKVFYLEHIDKDGQHKEINTMINNFHKDPHLYTFEHLNNAIACFHLKFQENHILTETNIKYAIKMDGVGNVKNSTTSGIEDFSYHGDNFILVIESSLLNGLESRKLEVAPVKKHVETIQNNNHTNKPILTLIVLQNEPDPGLQNDYIAANHFNIIRRQEVFYLALNFEYYKNLLLNNLNLNVLGIIQEIKTKVKNYNYNQPTLKSLLTFKDLNLEF